jgi:hypothetical protein
LIFIDLWRKSNNRWRGTRQWMFFNLIHDHTFDNKQKSKRHFGYFNSQLNSFLYTSFLIRFFLFLLILIHKKVFFFLWLLFLLLYFKYKINLFFNFQWTKIKSHFIKTFLFRTNSFLSLIHWIRATSFQAFLLNRTNKIIKENNSGKKFNENV